MTAHEELAIVILEEKSVGEEGRGLGEAEVKSQSLWKCIK